MTRFISSGPSRCSVFFFLLITFWAYAQRPKLRFHFRGLDDGLPQSTAEAIVQDDQGFIWVGTQSGLVRFDGAQFKVFRSDPHDMESLNYNFILSLAWDPKGFLWVATYGGGVARFDPRTEKFLCFGGSAEPGGFSHDAATSILVRRNGEVWIGTFWGVNIWQPETQTFKLCLANPNATGSSLENKVEALAEDGAGRVWGCGQGIFRMDDDGAFLEVPDPLKRFVNSRIDHIYMDGPNRMWFGVLNEGLYSYRIDTGVLERFGGLEQKRGLPGSMVTAMLTTRSGDFWVGSDGGLARLDRATQRFVSFHHRPYDKYSLSSNFITSIYESDEGVLWVGCNNGLNFIDPASEAFGFVTGDPQEQGAMAESLITSIFRDSRGFLWVGASENLYREDPLNGWFHIVEPAEKNEKFSGRVTSMFEDDDGNLLMGIANVPLARYNPGVDRLEYISKEEPLLANINFNVINRFTRDSQGRIWLSTNNNAWLYTSLDEPLVGLHELAPVNSEDWFLSFVISHENQIWVGGWGILVRLDDRFQSPFYFGDGEANLPSVTMMDAMVDQRDQLWIATVGGLARWVPEKEEFEVYGLAEGLPDDTVNSVLEDDQGNLWVSTNNGLSRFDPQKGKFNNFTIRNGLQGNEYNWRVSWKDTDGQLYFGGMNGFNRFYPERIKPNKTPPRMAFTGLAIHHKPVSHKDQNSLLHEPLSFTEELRLTHKEDVFSLGFAALHFSDPQSVTYQYRLTGFDRTWNQAPADEGKATYTNLKSGNYRFLVKASTRDGIWGAPISLKIHILPPPWLTWWAFLIYFAAVAGIVSLYVRAQRKALLRERAVNHRLKEVDRLKDEFLANTSHELRTPLNGIIGLAESLVHGVAGSLPEQVSGNLKMIVSSGRRLAGLVDDILDFSKLKNEKIELHLKAVDLRALVEVVFMHCRPLVKGRDLVLVNGVQPTCSAVLADEDRLSQILFNLVGNAVKFTESGEIAVDACCNEGGVRISVSDTGMGIDPSRLEAIFGSFEQADGSIDRKYGGSGLGLAITQMLVQAHGGVISVSSVPGEGSTFTLTLPLSKEAAKPQKPKLNRIRAREEPETMVQTRQTPADQEKKFHILIVDDEPINRQVLVNHLSAYYQLTEVCNGEEALAVIQTDSSIHLVLLDVMMPGLSGYDVCARIRKTLPVQELPIIFLTARNQVADLITAFNDGANDYLTKPIAREELLSRVKTHLQLLDAHRHLEQIVEDRTSELKTRNAELESLDAIVAAINRETHLENVLQTMLDQAMSLTPEALGGAFLVWEPGKNAFRLAACSQELKVPQYLTQDELESRFLNGADICQDGIYIKRNPPEGIEQGIAALMMTLAMDGSLQGILLLYSMQQNLPFGQADSDSLKRFRGHALSALAKARFLNDLQEKNREILRKRDQLVMQEKMASMGTLTAGLAHEIKNPLNFINNFSELNASLTRELRDELNGSRPQIHQQSWDVIEGLIKDLGSNSGRIHSHGKRVDSIVSRMMELAAPPKTNKQATNIFNVLNQYLALAMAGYRTDQQAPEILVEKEYQPSEVRLFYMTPQNLGRIFLSLINNALDAMKMRTAVEPDYQPALTLTARLDESPVRISVRDNGVGIHPDDIHRIFTPFFTSHTEPGHVGLGLTIAYDLAQKQFGGELRVDSVLGEYTEAILILPNLEEGVLEFGSQEE